MFKKTLTWLGWCGVLAGCGPIAAGIVVGTSEGGGSGGAAAASAPPVSFVESDQDFGDEAVDACAGVDVDGDGDVDLVLARDLDLDVYRYHDGAFVHSRQALSSDVGDIALGRLDGGPLPALVTAGDGARVYLQQTVGTFVATGAVLRISPSSSRTQAVALADMNADGHTDVTVIEESFRLGVFLNDGAGSFTLHHEATLVPSSSRRLLVLADVDRDGQRDVVVGGGRYTEECFLLMNRGDGSLDAPRSLGNSNALALHDVDDDGYLDLVGSWTQEFVRYNDRQGSFRPPVHFGPAHQGPAAFFASGDLDSRGREDLVGVKDGWTAVYLRAGRGYAFSVNTPSEYSDLLGRPRGVFIADWDDDGADDVLRVSELDVPRPVRLYLNRGLQQ